MMKKVLFVLLLLPCALYGQVLQTISHGGQSRQYLECVPLSYTGAQSVPLVICLHGLGDNMNNFSSIAMHYVGDTAGFITLYPQALTSPMGNAWNSGASYMGYILNGTVDDVGFISALIDTTAARYNVDLSRVYASGFSMGGFMSYRLACELGGRIAAIAPVAGTMGSSLNCTPTRPVPVCHFHGTADQTVYYTNNMYGSDAEETVDYWVNYNNCDTTPVYHAFANTVQDSIIVESFFYASPAGSADVMFYKATGAAHQWLYPPVNDIFYTTEIWHFLRNYSNPLAAVEESGISKKEISVYPNPATDCIHVVAGETEAGPQEYIIFTGDGRVVLSGKLQGRETLISLMGVSPGAYFIRIVSGKTLLSRSFMILR